MTKIARWKQTRTEDDVALTPRVAARFWSCVDTSGNCWLWLGQISDSGYGRFRAFGTDWVAHRIAWVFFRGSFPEGLEPDHLCRTKACVRPSHIEPVTHQVNVLRGTGPTAINARKTHCIRGHEFTPENTRIRRGHERACRPCIRADKRNARTRTAA